MIKNDNLTQIIDSNSSVITLTDRDCVTENEFNKFMAEIVAEKIGLNKVGRKIYLYILNNIPYTDKNIVLMQKDLMVNLNYKSTVSGWIGMSQLIQAGILQKKGKGIYNMNPLYFGKSKIEVRRIIQVSKND